MNRPDISGRAGAIFMALVLITHQLLLVHIDEFSCNYKDTLSLDTYRYIYIDTL